MQQPPRIAIGGIAHETHSFATRLTTLDDFRDQALHTGDAIFAALRGTRSVAGGMIDSAPAQWRLQPTVYAGAMPAGIVTEEAFSTILDELLTRLAAALPLDGVLLALHGAMVTETVLDAESHILAAVRDLVGADTPIVTVFDMHGNISAHSVEISDVVIAYDENPHVDPYARGCEAVAILEQLLAGAVSPAAGFAHPPLMLAPQATGTADLPLRAVHTRAQEMETEEAVLCVSVFGGFAYSDTPDAGVSVVVNTNGAPQLAQQYADELAAILMAHRDAAQPELLSAEAAVKQALTHDAGPVILVDSADNIGGGTPGDGTDALRAMLDANVQEGAVVIADPAAVALCWDAGVGASLTLEVGAKYDALHGSPITVSGVVQTLSEGTFVAELADNHFASFFGNTIHMGRSVWLRCGGVIPEQQKMIAVKSAVAYRAAYLPIASAVIEMDTAGLCSANLERFPYRHVRRPILPLDD